MTISGPQDGEKIAIRIDPDLADLIPGYLENRRKDVQSMRAALERGDFESIRILGHSMKGSGGGYGFAAVTEIGRALEGAARQGNAADIRRQVEELSSYLERIEIVYG